MQRLSRSSTSRSPRCSRGSSRGNDPLTPVTVQVRGPRGPGRLPLGAAAGVPGRRRSRPTYLRNYPPGARSRRCSATSARSRRPAEAQSRQSCDHPAQGERPPGDKVGQAGVEAAYDRYLRGRPGDEALRVDSLGRPAGDPAGRRAASRATPVRLTIDIALQRAAERALQYGIASRTRTATGPRTAARSSRSTRANGAILAMASSPTYKPSVFVGRLDGRSSRRCSTRTTAKEDELPRRSNRATQGLYPPARPSSR